ncbi:hypothetical protein [Microcoleus sp. FACHB-1515]|nr:hypothetical protein [Microcoleus sp. FACHB-1515]
MPTIIAQGKVFDCPIGAMRPVLLQHEIDLHNSDNVINCRGRGTCETCAV